MYYITKNNITETVPTNEQYETANNYEQAIEVLRRNYTNAICAEYNRLMGSRFQVGDYFYDGDSEARTFLIGALLTAQATGQPIAYTVFANETDVHGAKIEHTAEQITLVLATGASLVNGYQSKRDAYLIALENAETEEEIMEIIWNDVEED